MPLRALFAAVLTWVLPGLGHFVIGRRAKAFYFGGLVLGFFGLGLLLGEGASVSTARFPYHFIGQVLVGLPALLADQFLGVVPLGRTVDRLELGVVMTTVAGIMNLVVMVDAYETVRGSVLGLAPARESQG